MKAPTRQQWLHGFLELLVLSLLADKRDYGVGLTQRLASLGFDDVAGGTLYPSLLRLEKQGLVKTDSVPSSTGPRRRYYELTAAGSAALAERMTEWREFRGRVDRVTGGATDHRVGRA